MAMVEQSYFPISEISTYHSKWVLRARVTAKGTLRTFQARGGGSPGQVFDVHLLDESGSEIRASLFGTAAEMYKDKIEQGKVYTFSRGTVKIANRQYNRCPHRYELVFDTHALIEEVADCVKIQNVKFEIADLLSIQTRTLPCTVDICGVVVGFRPFTSFTSSAGRELVKREITIVDHTATSIDVALWGDRAKQDDKVFDNKPVIALKGVVVKEWRDGRSGSLLENGVMSLQPDIPEAAKIQQWWSKNSNANFTSLSLAQDGLIDLKALQTKTLPCTVELCGVVVSFKPLFSFTSKDGKDLKKRDIVIADDTGNSLECALWGAKAEQEDKLFENNPVVCLKGVRIQEWNGGRSGSMLAAGCTIFQPATPDAERIQAWWSQGGSTQSITALSMSGGGGGGGARTAGKAATFAEMREAAEQLGSNQTEVFSVVGRLALVQTQKQGAPQPLFYMACQEPKQSNNLPCNKRVDETSFCAACNRIVKAAPRFNLRCRFSDSTDSVWLTTFHESAQRVLERTSEEIQIEEQGEDGREKVEATIRRRYFQQPLQISVRAKIDYYNGEARPNITCMDARPVQRGVHARGMLTDIQAMLAQGDSAISVA